MSSRDGRKKGACSASDWRWGRGWLVGEGRRGAPCPCLLGCNRRASREGPPQDPLLPITAIPATSARGLVGCRDRCCRKDGFEPVSRYVTGLLTDHINWTIASERRLPGRSSSRARTRASFQRHTRPLTMASGIWSARAILQAGGRLGSARWQARVPSRARDRGGESAAWQRG